MSGVEDGSFQIATTDADNDFLASASLGAEPIDVGLNVSSIGNSLAETVAVDFVNLAHRSSPVLVVAARSAGVGDSSSLLMTGECITHVALSNKKCETHEIS
ncbi:hypothetical protein G3A56_01580 [Rhizobium oryzihabitans]|uniref:Uncharacterized protein n=1 Tax=Rhizobium oryzihabitans TaxID=2267833 RepID=A0A7L5BDI3_9HYPH|nr:hypothetical protein [Rhizobium oryzihabitans]QIB36849.1 hypothetical protein G3A56_01580 [Rhizobium oryzihabitans]